MSKGMESTTFSTLQAFVLDTIGLEIPLERRDIVERKLLALAKKYGFNECSAYLAKIERIAPDMSNQMYAEFIDSITTHETSFFRHSAQLQILQHTIFPTYIEKNRNNPYKSIRIWSAGCSTGEEPYTIAMILAEALGAQRSAWDIAIVGTDISTHVLETARAGIYQPYSIRNMPDMYSKYITKKNNTIGICQEIKHMVSFEYVNLKDIVEKKGVPIWDIIFCRNVLIYFTQNMASQVVQSFYNQLLHGGFFFVGNSENIRKANSLFTPFIEGEKMIYKKG